MTRALRRAVPYFDYQNAFKPYEEEFVGIFRDILARGAFIQQRDLKAFEENLASYLGARHAIGVGNATDGMIMAWRAAGLEPGDEVILPSHTMVASAASIHFAGGVPVPVECGADHLLDPEAIEPSITPRTRAIMPVQLNGRTCSMDRIQEIADRHGLMILEDAAQGLGSRYRGRLAGTFGVASAFSFYPAKVLGCLGDGGAVVTDDDRVAEQVRLLRDHGRDPRTGEVSRWGLNSRLDNLQAAFLDAQLRRYSDILTRRRRIAAMYQELLGGIEELRLPPAPVEDGIHYDTFQNYELQAERRDELRDHLRDKGVGTLTQWGGKAVHQWSGLGFDVTLPQTERLFERCLMLPMNTTLTDEDVAYVSESVRGFYTGGA